MRRAHAVLRWFCLEDRSHKLSLTTVAFIFALACIWTGKAISLPELGVFVAAVVAHRSRANAETKLQLAHVPPGPGTPTPEAPT